MQFEYDCYHAPNVAELEKILKYHGENGWELVTVLSIDGRVVAFFKRQLGSK